MSGKNLKPYQIDKLGAIPTMIKMILIKWWFAGAVFYIAGFGISILSIGTLETAIIIGIILGLLNEYIVKNVIKFMSTSEKDLTPHIEVRSSLAKGLILNIIFGLIISICIMYFYEFINIAIINIFELEDKKVVLFVEPFTYGLVYLGFDYIYLGIRNTIFKK